MRKFYLFQKGQPLDAKLTWSHYVVLLNLKDNSKIDYYAKQVIIRNLSKRDLQKIIKSKEYERLDENTKNKLINKEEEKIVIILKQVKNY